MHVCVCMFIFTPDTHMLCCFSVLTSVSSTLNNVAILMAYFQTETSLFQLIESINSTSRNFIILVKEYTKYIRLEICFYFYLYMFILFICLCFFVKINQLRISLRVTSAENHFVII